MVLCFILEKLYKGDVTLTGSFTAITFIFLYYKVISRCEYNLTVNFNLTVNAVDEPF